MQVSRARARFFRGQVPLLLYTGRAQFFFRHKLRGARHLVLYGLPEGCGQLYGELVSAMDEAAAQGHKTDALALFSKFDQFALERCLGAANAREMLTAPRQAYLFC